MKRPTTYQRDGVTLSRAYLVGTTTVTLVVVFILVNVCVVAVMEWVAEVIYSELDSIDFAPD